MKQQKKMLLNARITALAGGFAAWPSAVLLAVLGVSAFATLQNRVPLTFGETTVPQAHGILTLLLSFAVLAALLGALLTLAYHKITATVARIATGAAALVHTALAFWWCHSFVITPYADQKNVWTIAEQFAQNLEMTGQDYLARFPYQGRMAVLMARLDQAFGNTPMVWAMFGTLCCGVCVLALCGICGRISGSAVAQFGCAVLCTLFLPPVLYASFIYGTVSSMAFAFVGCYAAVRLCQSENPAWWAVLFVAFPLSVNLYSQGVIFEAAACIVLAFTALLRKNLTAFCKLALPIVALVAATLLSCSALQTSALQRVGLPADEPGIPLSATVMMGLHSDSGSGPGGYDASHYNLYGECESDAAATDAAAKAYIAEYLADFAHNPSSALHFFAGKTGWQWQDPWFESLAMNSPGVTIEPRWFATAMTSGALSAPVCLLLGALLTLVYLAAGVGTLLVYKGEKTAVYKLLPAICFLGGFLFQLVWESKSRYCMPYFYMLMPLAAISLTALAAYLNTKFSKAGEGSAG